jgi:hypothetical protein
MATTNRYVKMTDSSHFRSLFGRFEHGVKSFAKRFTDTARLKLEEGLADLVYNLQQKLRRKVCV